MQIVHLQDFCKVTHTMGKKPSSFQKKKKKCQQHCVKGQYTKWWKQWITGSALEKIKNKKFLFLDDALFTLQCNVNRESNEYWCYKKSAYSLLSFLYIMKCSEYRKNYRANGFLDKTISDHHVKQILAQLTALTEEENVGKSTSL